VVNSLNIYPRPEQNFEWLIFLAINGSGVTLGVFASSWATLGIGAVVVGVLLNAFLLIRVTIATGHTDKLLRAVALSVPAGIYDALKIFFIGLVVRWIFGFVSALNFLGTFLALQGVLVVVVFLFSLNEFLQGSQKTLIDSVLSLLVVSLLVLAYIAIGWQATVITLVLSFTYGMLFRPITARLASRLLSIDSDCLPSRHIGLPNRRLSAISRKLDQESQKQLFDQDRHDDTIEALLDYCESDRNLQKVLAQFDISRKELREVFLLLVSVGAGQWVRGHYIAASAISYPHTLRYILSCLASEEDILKAANRVIMHFERGTALE